MPFLLSSYKLRGGTACSQNAILRWTGFQNDALPLGDHAETWSFWRLDGAACAGYVWPLDTRITQDTNNRKRGRHTKHYYDHVDGERVSRNGVDNFATGRKRYRLEELSGSLVFGNVFWVITDSVNK
jgi:hypothetical protein